VAATLARLKPTTTGIQHDRAALAKGVDRVETELRNAAVADGGELASLLDALKEREADRERLRRQLANSQRAGRKTVATPSKLREEVEEKLADWRGVLTRQTTTARQIVKKLLVCPLLFTPRQGDDGTPYYEFEGEGTLAKMLVSLTQPLSVASPARLAVSFKIGESAVPARFVPRLLNSKSRLPRPLIGS
jgi:hypothetical protein